MPTHRYQRREPTHDWQQIRPLLKDQAQVTYELIRPVILPKGRVTHFFTRGACKAVIIHMVLRLMIPWFCREVSLRRK